MGTRGSKCGDRGGVVSSLRSPTDGSPEAPPLFRLLWEEGGGQRGTTPGCSWSTAARRRQAKPSKLPGSLASVHLIACHTPGPVAVSLPDKVRASPHRLPSVTCHLSLVALQPTDEARTRDVNNNIDDQTHHHLPANWCFCREIDNAE